ncbi:gfo/Idh/MocA family oxidoreductase [Candidatus Fermentibacteria bacterium]|nr:gfo/Idh/MocA family oxidoreductase [Candidatus Fermentibacteria bacterium]
MRAGVIGVGHLGYHHARILRGLVGDVAIFDTDSRRSEEVSGELDVHPCSSLNELLDRVEMAVVACPTTHHHRVALEAMEKNVDLLVEKPLASSVPEAEEMVDLSAESGVVVGVGHVERFNPAVMASVDLIRKPLFVEGHRLAPFKPRGTDVSVVMDLMIHDIDLVLCFARSEVEEVRASGVPVLSDNVDIASARIQFRDGATANITASRISREPVRKLRFFQRSSYVSIDFAGKMVEAYRLKAGQIVPVEVPIPGADALQTELSDFIAACTERRRPMVSAGDGLRALRVADMISRSMKESLERFREGS